MIKKKLFVSLGSLGVLTALGLVIYFDEDLRQRVGSQISKALDTSEKLMNTVQQATGTASSDESQITARQEEALNQWAHLTR